MKPGTERSVENERTSESKLTVLQEQIRRCRLCQEHGYIVEAHPIVSGRVSDPILVIGQAPGHRSVAKDRPFSGPGGRILQKWLEQAGFPAGYLHERSYLSSLTRCDPGKNPRGDGDRRPSPPELALCRPYLEAEIRILQPRVILLVGTMAIEALFLQDGQSGSGDQREARGVISDRARDDDSKTDPRRPKKASLEKVIGTYQERGESLLLPLPHPSGVSRWLNTPEHQQLLQQALLLLAKWRQDYGL